MEPTKWQRAWVAKSFAPGVRVSALSVTRANGKTALCGHLCAEALTPGTSSFDHRTEVVIVASSMEQVRTMFGFVQDELDDRGVLDDYRFVDSNQRLGVLHKPSGAKLRAISSDPKRAMGLSRFKTIIGDEPCPAWCLVASEADMYPTAGLPQVRYCVVARSGGHSDVSRASAVDRQEARSAPAPGGHA